MLRVPTDRASIEASVHETLERLTTGAAFVFAVFLVLHLWETVGGDSRVALPMALDVACGLVAGGAALWLRGRTAGSLAQTESLAFVCVGAVVVNNAISAWWYSDARELFYASFLLLALGAVCVRRIPARIVALAIAAETIGMATLVRRGDAVRADADDTAWTVLIIMSSMVLAAALHASRRATFAKLAELRRAERARAAELEAQLAERIRVEAEREQLAERERELADQLRHVQKLDALGTLAGGVAHDINNILGAILGLAELGVDGHPEGSPEREEFTHIFKAAQRGAALTHNLLGFARRGKHRHEPVDVGKVVGEVVGLLSRTASRQITLVHDVEPDATSARVLGDPDQLSHVFMNLCLNSIDAITGEGRIELAVSTVTVAERERPTLPGGAYLRVTVRDTGAGMSADTIAHAFEPFYSTKSETTKRTGLGLAMVYGTIRDHLGEVTLESARGQGTTATIYLPTVSEAEVREATPQPVPVPAAPPTPLTPVAVPKTSVLVVDDEAALRRVCTRFLRAHDLATTEAESGDAGLAMFKASPSSYSLVLLDLAMPGMTGAECFVALRELDARLPIILMSGFPKDQRIEELLLTGRATFLSKPFRRNDLVAALELVQK